MKTKVALVRCASYEPAEIAEKTAELMELLGGMGRFVKRGGSVLLKPNLLKGAEPERAITTHPEFIKAAAKLAREAGGVPSVGDSPSFGSLEGVAKKAGVAAMAEEAGLPLVPFNRPVSVPFDSRAPIHFLQVDKAVLEADVLINLPKLKTHQQLGLTCGVKNLFGCVSGKRKAVWHMTSGNHHAFPRMLIEVVRAVKPALTLVDAVVAMEGNGPGNGSPRQVGLLIGSEDPVAIDRVVCEILGMDAEKLSILRAARDLEFGATELKDIEIAGEALEDVKVAGFQLPRLVPIGFSLPRVARSVVKNLLVTAREG